MVPQGLEKEGVRREAHGDDVHSGSHGSRQQEVYMDLEGLEEQQNTDKPK